jgi:hypothetical protein
MVFPARWVGFWQSLAHVHTYLGRPAANAYLPFYTRPLQFVVNYLIVFPAVLVIVGVYSIALMQLLDRTNWVLSTSDPNSPEPSSPKPEPSPETAVEPPSDDLKKKFLKFSQKMEVVYHYLVVIHEFMNDLFYLGGHYGLFANMTKTRYEINVYLAHCSLPNSSPTSEASSIAGSSSSSRVSEDSTEWRKELLEATKPKPTKSKTTKGSSSTTSFSSEQKEEDADEDGIEWELLQFRYKPDNLYLLPKLVAPYFHMPRFDWCLWFLSFKPVIHIYPKWFFVFLLTIMEYAQPRRNNHSENLEGKEENNDKTGEPEKKEEGSDKLDTDVSFCEDIVNLLAPESKILLQDLSAQASLHKHRELLVKVTLSVYEFNPEYNAISSPYSSKKFDSPTLQLPVWTKKQEKILLNKVSLEKLYEIYDLICEKEDGILEERMRKRQARQAKVDSPGEILYRTFKKYSDLKKDKRKFN